MPDLLRDLARAKATFQLKAVMAVIGDRPMPNPEGFTDALEEACERRCQECGDPPCWRLPALVEPCEHITPCEECLAEVAAHPYR